MGSSHQNFEFDPKSFTYFREGKMRFFCPLCHHHQSTNTIERVAWWHHGQIAIFTAATMLATWPIFGINGLLFYLLWWAGFELVYRLRKREALVCRECGFDPFLYKRDQKAARAAVQKYLQSRIENENLFSGVKLKNYQTKQKIPPGASVQNNATPVAGENNAAGPTPENAAAINQEKPVSPGAP